MDREIGGGVERRGGMNSSDLGSPRVTSSSSSASNPSKWESAAAGERWCRRRDKMERRAKR